MKKLLSILLLSTISLTIKPCIPDIQQNSPSCKDGNTGSLTAQNCYSGNHIYLWSNGATTATINNLAPGTYTCTIDGEVTVGEVEIIGGSISNIISPSCGSATGSATYIQQAGSSVVKFNGISTTVTDSLVLNNLYGGTYTITAVSTYSNITCYDTLHFTISNTKPPLPICLITVDQSSSYNTLIWDKTNATPTDSFCIYREVSTNTYSKIATVPPDSLSEYNDLGANPNVTSYTYVMTVKDTCGNESVYSNSHSTIHLQSNGNGNLAWTLYQIQNTANPVNYYVVYRDSLGTGNFTPISSTIPGTNTTFTDVNYAAFPKSRYYISVSWNITCNPTRSAGTSTTRSNIKNGTGDATGISEFNNDNLITIYPNPTTGIFQISGAFQTANVYSSSGSLILTSSSKSIDLTSFSNGIYFVQVNNNFYKLIKIN